MKLFIKIRTSFEGIHRWADAPEEVKFLRDYHRHIFYVSLLKEVLHHDREIEFISLKRKVNEYLNRCYGPNKPTDNSCEFIAAELLGAFDAQLVEVSEDGENGAVAIRTKEDDLDSSESSH